MKRIAVLVIEDQIGEFFKRELLTIFENQVTVDYYCPGKVSQPLIDEVEVVLYTDPSILIEMMDYIRSPVPLVMMKRTITGEGVRILKGLKKGSSAYVYNLNSFMANETLATLYGFGIDGLSLYPLDPAAQVKDTVDYIITPGEHQGLEAYRDRVVDIGNRIFDPSTILDLIATLNIDRRFADRIVKRYAARVPAYWKGLRNTLYDKKMLSGHLELVMNEFDRGVVLLDDKEEILLLNETASNILGLEKTVLEGEALQRLVAGFPGLERLGEARNFEGEIIEIGGQKVVVDLKEVRYDGVFFGKLILMKVYAELLKEQSRLHGQLTEKGYYAKYVFEDIVGEDDALQKTIEISRNVASSSSSVLILGETGTGKELFAGAIHNYSPRKNKPYIAINCATLPENLLESELFGYEGGAFTGAKKGGKLGVFERAQGGTLFLDEVGEIPLNLQARLLRALQEKEIMRVGGDAIIHVDVRIVAASNRDLNRMAEEGAFRRDLFYRLNVFSVKLPALREHKKDLPALIAHFLKELGEDREVDKSFVDFAGEYSWPGNVRELRNTLEYMVRMDRGALHVRNLPSHLKLEGGGKESPHEQILEIVRRRAARGLGTGRRSIMEEFSKTYYKISEGRIREYLEELAARGQIRIFKGRKGCQPLDEV
ncbi:MAG: hypothetical protein AVO33_01350 [delta proteobacterium ML8_F1]|nr:MAG: hypothetical protein AVO33_01350 [delta proteobacterium ML8_F1]